MNIDDRVFQLFQFQFAFFDTPILSIIYITIYISISYILYKEGYTLNYLIGIGIIGIIETTGALRSFFTFHFSHSAIRHAYWKLTVAY